MSECPVCALKIITTDIELNELVPCPDCGSDLEVISLDPISFDIAPEEMEDWGE
jgi:alpha-aminoadipate carrier protein LysW